MMTENLQFTETENAIVLHKNSTIDESDFETTINKPEEKKTITKNNIISSSFLEKMGISVKKTG